jgi:hypothetical protein
VAVAILANPESSGCRTLQTPFRRPADAFAKAPAFNSASCFAEFFAVSNLALRPLH